MYKNKTVYVSIKWDGGYSICLEIPVKWRLGMANFDGRGMGEMKGELGIWMGS